MEYPKDEIEVCEQGTGQAYTETLKQFMRVINYAKWAHEQLRPRKVSEEPPKSDAWVFVWLKSGVWAHAKGSVANTGYPDSHWLPMPPPPPKPDKFEEWWENGGSLKHCGTGTTWKEDFKGAWDACKKAYGVEE